MTNHSLLLCFLLSLDLIRYPLMEEVPVFADTWHKWKASWIFWSLKRFIEMLPMGGQRTLHLFEGCRDPLLPPAKCKGSFVSRGYSCCWVYCTWWAKTQRGRWNTEKTPGEACVFSAERFQPWQAEKFQSKTCLMTTARLTSLPQKSFEALVTHSSRLVLQIGKAAFIWGANLAHHLRGCKNKQMSNFVILKTTTLLLLYVQTKKLSPAASQCDPWIKVQVSSHKIMLIVFLL